MLSIAMGWPCDTPSEPKDASDFSLCYLLVRAIPEIHNAFPEIGRRVKAFKPILASWVELCWLYESMTVLADGTFACHDKILRLRGERLTKPRSANIEAASKLPRFFDMHPGSWVMCGEYVAKVRDAFMGVGENPGTYAPKLNLVLYALDGTRIGRASPRMGGPRDFEPACNVSLYEPIETPNFDLLRRSRYVVRLREIPGAL
jgi:hypothetical protein